MYKIHKTSDYSQFKLFESNRDIKPEHVIKSIKKKNLLHENPILVTRDMQVLDGQNRLAAAKELGVPIYYHITDDVNEMDIPLLQNQRFWNLEDYCKFYSFKNPIYKSILNISKKYGYAVAFIIRCTGANGSKYNEFKQGKYIFSQDIDIIEKKFEQLTETLDILNKLKKARLRRNTMHAIWYIVNSKNYDHAHFLERMQQLPSEVQSALKMFTTRDCYNYMAKKIYNHKLKLKARYINVASEKNKYDSINDLNI